MSTCIVCGSNQTVEDGTRGARCDLHATGRRVDSDPVAAAEAAYRDACVAYTTRRVSGLGGNQTTWDDTAQAAAGAYSALQQARSRASQQQGDEEIARALHGTILWETPARMQRIMDVSEARCILSALRAAGWEIRRRE